MVRPSRPRLALIALLAGTAVAVASFFVYGALTSSAYSSPPMPPVLAGFGERSFRPGQVASLAITSAHVRRVTLQLFLAGAVNGDAPIARQPGWDDEIFGAPVTAPRLVPLRVHTTLPIHIPADWPSGDYVVRLTWPGHSDYAPFVLRPPRLGTVPVLVVEPTNTWHAYNALNGDSWYMDDNVHVIGLAHPFAAAGTNGKPIPAGLPGQFRTLDVGFLRWFWQSGYRADFVSDDDLEAANLNELLRYRLIVFGGHEEYVTAYVYKLIRQYRDAGGNLAFLSANSFYWRVVVHGNTMVGRTRWRDLGKPEAALVGGQYVGWDDGGWPNKPYVVVDTAAAPWLFTGTGLHDGSTFGAYGIEIDEPNAASPAGTKVVARIPNEFGSKDADMTIYRKGNSTVFNAGAMNFGASSHWPGISRMVSNLWSHLSGERPTLSR